MSQFSARSGNLFCHQNSRNFDFQIGFSSKKKKQNQNVPKLKNIIYSEPHLSQFWVKSENLFFTKILEISTLKLDFLPIKKAKSEYSKIKKYYILWTSSEQILSKIREPFRITKIFELNLDFFPIRKSGIQNFPN